MTEENPAGVMATIHRVESPGAPIPSSDGSPEMRESSNVLVEEEMIALTVAKHGYNANLKVMKAQDDLLGSLFDTQG